MLLIQLMGGLALITFGVRFLRKGFDRLFGGKVAVWLEKTARTPFRAMLAGVATGSVAPSSTGLAVLINHILEEGKVRTNQMLAVLLGTNIGLTVLANIVALDMNKLSGVLLFFGVIAFQFCSGEKVRGIGQSMLAFGFVFLAMTFLEEAGQGIKDSEHLMTLFTILDHFPLALCLVATVLGVLLQSSTATVGLGIGLAQSGALPDSLFMVWIVGTNLGLGVTALIVSWPQREGRRLGYANMIAKLLTAIPLLLLSSWIPFSNDGIIPPGNQLALAHTGFNILTGIIALPILNPLIAIARNWLVPEISAQEEQTQHETFLLPESLETPSVALIQATREVLRMSDAVRSMLMDFWSARGQKNMKILRSIKQRDDEVDRLNQQLAIYLSQITHGLDETETRWRFTLLSFTGELESVGDILEKELSAIAIKQVQSGWVLADEEEESLTMLYQKTNRQFDRVLSILTMRDQKAATDIVAVKDEISAWCLMQKKMHYQSLKPDLTEIDSTLGYLDLIDALRRINKHLATATYSFLPSEAISHKWETEKGSTLSEIKT